MNRLPYQITVAWSTEDEAYEARVPALRNCIAYGETAEEAVKEVTIAAGGWLETAEKYGHPIPKPDASLERLATLSEVLNLSAVARAAGIHVQTLATKLKRGTPLSADEAERVGQVLQSHGVPA